MKNTMTNKSVSADVSFEQVYKKYGDVTAINNLSLNIKAGELVTLLGPSGCGKTTTLRMIAGLEDATSGRVIIGGKDVTDLSATYRNVAMVFQSYALFPHMNVLDNVAYGLTVSSMSKKLAEKKAIEGLSMVGLAGYEDRLPSELSGGQQQRVAVARAVVLEPEVLLFDEPLSNLDAKLRRHVREEIRQIQQKLGLTAVYVTHDQEEAMAVSDRIIVMKDGIIAQQGTPTELYDLPNSEFIADFIGNANILPCELLEVTEGIARVQFQGITLNSRCSGKVAAPIKLIVHPQNIRLSKQPGNYALQGVVQQATYLGNHIEYDVEIEGEKMFVVDNQMEGYFEQGESVFVHFPKDKTSVVAAG